MRYLFIFLWFLFGCASSKFCTDTYVIKTNDGKEYPVKLKSWHVPAAMNECVQEWFIMQNGLSSEDVESFTLTERVIARKKPTKNYGK